MRLSVLAAAGSIAAFAPAAAAGPVPSIEAPYIVGALPPNPTVYFKVHGNQDGAAKDVEAQVTGIFTPVPVRPIQVGHDLLFAVAIPLTQGEIVVSIGPHGWGQIFGGTIAPRAARPTSAVALALPPHLYGDPAVMVSFSGRGVGYWEIATPQCGTFAELPRYRDGGLLAERSVDRACLSGGKLAVTAHYLDGSSERLAVPAAPPQIDVLPVSTLPPQARWWFVLAGLGLAAVGASLQIRRRRATPVR